MEKFGENFIRSATNEDCENVQNLVFGVLREYGLEPDTNGTDGDIADIEKNYQERGGIFEIIEDESGNLLGTVGLFPLGGKTIELRKMYFSKHLRGKGFGKKLLERMIEKAETLGCEKIFLETASVLKEAIGLYEKYGFRQTNETHTARCDKSYFLEI